MILSCIYIAGGFHGEIMKILKNRLSKSDYQKLMQIDNPAVHTFIAKYIDLCNPKKVFVYTDSEEDIKRTREAAIRNKEEGKLVTDGHTMHFDGYYDQARDKEKTKFLLPLGSNLGPEINAINRDEGLREIHDIMTNIMDGHELHIKFFCLGPTNSPFSIPVFNSLILPMLLTVKTYCIGRAIKNFSDKAQMPTFLSLFTRKVNWKRQVLVSWLVKISIKDGFTLILRATLCIVLIRNMGGTL